MTREEAKREMMFAKRNVLEGSYIDQAYDVAIQALSQPERKKGEWVGVVEYCKHLEEETGERYQPSGMGNTIYCNQCWSETTRKSDYCPKCGADMRR